MRLWHEGLLPILPQKQLQAQHRECCALRGMGWGKPHSTVDYAFNYAKETLVAYHWRVMDELNRRTYNPGVEWRIAAYRGKTLGFDYNISQALAMEIYASKDLIYIKHDEDYKQECLSNIERKGFSWLKEPYMKELTKYKWLPLKDTEETTSICGVYNHVPIYNIKTLTNVAIPCENDGGIIKAATPVSPSTNLELLIKTNNPYLIGYIYAGEYILVLYNYGLISCRKLNNFNEEVMTVEYALVGAIGNE